MIKAAINGFGRIGRNVLRAYIESGGAAAHGYDIVAINYNHPSAEAAHLFKYDSCFGVFDREVKALENALSIDGKSYALVADRDPAKLPWEEMGVELVIESTGKFNDREGASKHLTAGAKKVLLTAPGKDEDITLVLGVNEQQYDPKNHHIISNASCTTNCLAPFAKVIDERFGIVKGLMTTVHAYTNDQGLLDQSHKDLRRARAGALSIIPTTTGAAKAVALVLPKLKGKLNGFSLRVPTPTVSVVDLVVELEKEASKESINQALEEASKGALQGILGYTEEPLVSIDFKKDPRSSIIDAQSTMVIEGNMAKIVSWYDNEWGYSCRVVDMAQMIAQAGL